MTCCGTIREELRPRHLVPSVEHVHHICKSQWRIPNNVFIGYRVVASCYIIAWNACGFVTVPWIGRHFCLVFITGWAYLLLAIYFVVASLATIIFACREHYFIEDQLVGECEEDPSEVVVVVTNGDNKTVKSPHVYISSNLETCEALEDDRRGPGEGSTCPSSGSHHRANEFPVIVNGSSSEEEKDKKCETIPLSQGTELNADTSGKISLATPPEVTFPDNANTSIPPSLWVTTRLTLLLFNVVSSTSLVISITYFAVILPIIHSFNANYRPTSIDWNVHAINSILVFTELFISQIRVRLLHVIYPFIFSVSYIVFTLIYWAMDPKENILYPYVLDWRDPKFTAPIAFGFVVVVLPIFHILVFLLVQVRIAIHKYVSKKYKYCS